MISKIYQERRLINSAYVPGLQIPCGRNTPLQPRPFQWVNWFKCGAMTDIWAQAVARVFNWQSCNLSLITGAEFCFSARSNTDHKTSENEFLESIKKGLPLVDKLGYVYPAPHKTGAGICTPCKLKATPDAASVFFVVRYTRHSMAWCVLLNPVSIRIARMSTAHHAAHNGTICGCCVRLRPAIDAQNRISRRPRMVTLAGQPQGWPVPFSAGSANPVNVTAPIDICTSSGDSLIKLKEAVYHG